MRGGGDWDRRGSNPGVMRNGWFRRKISSKFRQRKQIKGVLSGGN